MQTHPTGGSRGHKKREKTRSQLVAAALRVLAEKGEALTASDVVSAADVSNGTFYNYFADREELFDALARHLVLSLAAEAAREVSADDAALRFATTTARVLRRASRDPTWGRVVTRLAGLRLDVRDEVSRYLREDVALGLEQGRFDKGPDDATIDLVLGTLLLAVRRLAAANAEPGYAERVVARLLSALGVRAAEADGLARSAFEEPVLRG